MMTLRCITQSMVLYIIHNILHRMCNLIKCSGAISRLWVAEWSPLWIHPGSKPAVQLFSFQLARHNHQELSSETDNKLKQSKKKKNSLQLNSCHLSLYWKAADFEFASIPSFPFSPPKVVHVILIPLPWEKRAILSRMLWRISSG